MKRDRGNRSRRLRKGLLFEALEARRYLAADLGSSFLLTGKEYVPNELLVQYSAQAVVGQRNLAIVGTGASVAETIHTKAMQASGMGVLERVTLGAGTDMEAAMQAIKKNPNVLYVEPNYIYRPSVVSNDTYYTNGSLWGMYSNDTPSAVGPANTTNLFGNQAEKAWNENLIGNANIVVGIIDEGVQFSHPDLVDNMWLNPFEVAGDGIDNDGNGYIDDLRGWDFVSNDNSVFDAGQDAHGTHVAGTIGGTGGNGTGVVGVNWDITMISLKFLGPTGGSTANAVKALDYVTDLKNRHGINIVATNNSWGGGGYSQSLHNAIIRSAKKDILFVAAAGNSTSNNDTTASYPSNYNTTVGTSTETAASYDSVIAVASITSTGAISGFSSYGATTVDIGAPGSGIWSTVPTNGYASYNGTSMATPHVTGAVALYASTKPAGTSAASIRQAILQSATPTASLAGKTVTGGRLNVYEAVRTRSSIDVSAPSPSATTTEAGGSISFTVKLGSAPTANVTIPVSSSDTTEGSVSTASLVFTAANWNTAQTVTVTGVNDSVDDGNVGYSIVLGAAISTDTVYNNINPNDVSLINQDDDTAAIIVSAPSGTTTSETGGSVTFSVRLDSEPTANVTIPISSRDTSEGTVSTASLVFTAANWSTAQTVTVTGVNDPIDDGNIGYTIVVGAAVSTDTSYNGINPNDISLTNQDDDTAGITVSAPSGTTTTEAGGSVNFTVRLNSEPTADVTIPISSSDTSEGTVSIASLVFKAANWNTAQTVTVTGIDDKIFDGNIIYTIVIGAAVSSDILYNGSNPADFSLTNTDDEPPPTTKFYVVDDASANRTFEYDTGGGSVEDYALTAANSTPRGVATNVAGDRVWVVDNNRTVFVYNNSGALLGSWSAGSMPTNALVEGITTDGTHVWIVDNRSDRVYFYANAASRVSGSQNATNSFLLSTSNRNPRDLVTDGIFLWVVNDSTSNLVFRYSIAGVLQNSWSLNSANGTPTGITLDPSDGSQDLWVGDSGTDRVYRYGNARTLSAPTLTSFFPLAAGNTNPQGIADPPAAEALAQFEVFVDGSTARLTDRPSELLGAGTVEAKPRAKLAKPTASDLRDQVFAELGSELA